jgi:hypothetical protein
MQCPSENSPTQPPKLRDQVRDKIRLKHYSIRTEQAYTDWIKRFILHFGKKHPRDMGAAGVEQFLARKMGECKIGRGDSRNPSFTTTRWVLLSLSTHPTGLKKPKRGELRSYQ